MAVFNKREKVISFRVSEEEYEALREMSLKRGAHSVADFARMVACTFSSQPNMPSTEQIGREVSLLRSRLEDFMERMPRSKKADPQSLPPEILDAAEVEFN